MREPMTAIPDYGDLMALEEFVECVNSGGFIDYDGTGYYATDKEYSEIEAIPSVIKKGVINKKFSHVLWFNR